MKNTTLPQQINNHFMDANATNIYETRKLVFQTGNALKAILISFLVFVLSIILLNATAQTVQTFTTSGSWTCPAGVTAIKVEAWGGGGAGGGANQTTTGGGGGGGGSYNVQTSLTVVPGTSYSYTVGLGGVGTTGNGASGGTSIFSSLTAFGGTGGSAAVSSGTSAAGGAGGAIGFGGSAGGGFTGGNGANSIYIDASTYQSGGAGGGAGSTGNGGNASGITAGLGGATSGGDGGAGTTTKPSVGNDASTVGIGGGGGGAVMDNNVANTRKAGDGKNGQIKITYYSTSCLAPNTYSIGPTGNYASITNVVSLLSGACALSGSYIFEFQNTYSSAVETFPITFPAFFGSGANRTVTFKPAAGANISITSNNAGATIDRISGRQRLVLWCQ